MAVNMTAVTKNVKANWTRSNDGRFIGLNKSGTTGGGAGSGQTITFNGSGYGIGNAGFTWSDNTDYQLANGTEIPTGGNYRANGGTYHNPFNFDTAVKVGDRAGSLKGLRKCEISPANSSKTTKLYATWMVRFDCALNDDAYIDTNVHAFDVQSNKLIRVWDGSNTNTDTWISWTQRHLTHPDTPSSQNSHAHYNSFLPTANQWSRMEIIVDGGEIEARVDGIVRHSLTDHVKQGSGDYYIEILGYDMNYTDHIQQDFHTYLAEMYWLPSEARVEVSDSATWNGGAITRYIQNVTTWTDSQIQFELFRGDFAEQTTLYAYAVQADGSAVSLGQVQ